MEECKEDRFPEGIDSFVDMGRPMGLGNVEDGNLSLRLSQDTDDLAEEDEVDLEKEIQNSRSRKRSIERVLLGRIEKENEIIMKRTSLAFGGNTNASFYSGGRRESRMVQDSYNRSSSLERKRRESKFDTNSRRPSMSIGVQRRRSRILSSMGRRRSTNRLRASFVKSESLFEMLQLPKNCRHPSDIETFSNELYDMTRESHDWQLRSTSVSTFKTVVIESDAMRFASGETIVSEGSAGFDVFIVLDGKIQLHRNRLHLRTMVRGDMFGEMAVIDGGSGLYKCTARVASGEAKILAMRKRIAETIF